MVLTFAHARTNDDTTRHACDTTARHDAQAWVDDGYRGMNVASGLYLETARGLHERNATCERRCGCRQVVCDVLEGSLERIVAASPLLAFLWWTGVGGRIVEKRHASYTSDTDSGKREQFER